MNRDYIPDSPINLRNWADNLLAEIDPIATRIGWTAPVQAFKDRLTRLRSLAQAVIEAQNAVSTAQGTLSAGRDEEIPEIRLDLNNLKSTRGFHDGDARTLDILTSNGSGFDAATYKPPLSVESHRGHNTLMAKKGGLSAINLYMRRKGETAWTLLAAKRLRFPFEDDTPPLVPGQPEEREYYAQGLIGDQEAGQPSDIVSAIFRP